MAVAATLAATGAAQNDGSPSGMANFELRRGAQREPLQVMRSSSRIEYRYIRRDMREIWSRETGELQHWKVFPAAGRSVHYTVGDLRTIGNEPSWERLTGLIEPSARAALRPKNASRAGRADWTTSEGTYQQRRTRLVWDNSTGWPVELDVADGQHGLRIVRRSLEACAPSGCAFTDTSTYEEVEFADLGDKENDPFVRRFLAEHAHAHGRAL